MSCCETDLPGPIACCRAAQRLAQIASAPAASFLFEFEDGVADGDESHASALASLHGQSSFSARAECHAYLPNRNSVALYRSWRQRSNWRTRHSVHPQSDEPPFP